MHSLSLLDDNSNYPLTWLLLFCIVTINLYRFLLAIPSYIIVFLFSSIFSHTHLPQMNSPIYRLHTYPFRILGARAGTLLLISVGLASFPSNAVVALLLLVVVVIILAAIVVGCRGMMDAIAYKRVNIVTIIILGSVIIVVITIVVVNGGWV